MLRRSRRLIARTDGALGELIESLGDDAFLQICSIAAGREPRVLANLFAVCRAWCATLAAEGDALWQSVATLRYPRLRGLVPLLASDAPCYRALCCSMVAAEHVPTSVALSGIWANPPLQLPARSQLADFGFTARLCFRDGRAHAITSRLEVPTESTRCALPSSFLAATLRGSLLEDECGELDIGDLGGSVPVSAVRLEVWATNPVGENCKIWDSSEHDAALDGSSIVFSPFPSLMYCKDVHEINSLWGSSSPYGSESWDRWACSMSASLDLNTGNLDVACELTTGWDGVSDMTHMSLSQFHLYIEHLAPFDVPPPTGPAPTSDDYVIFIELSESAASGSQRGSLVGSWVGTISSLFRPSSLLGHDDDADDDLGGGGWNQHHSRTALKVVALESPNWVMEKWLRQRRLHAAVIVTHTKTLRSIRLLDSWQSPSQQWEKSDVWQAGGFSCMSNLPAVSPAAFLMPGKELNMGLDISLVDDKLTAQLYFDAAWMQGRGTNRLSCTKILTHLESFAPWCWSQQTQGDYWLDLV